MRQRAKSESPNGAKPRALISVSDKTGMTELAEGLNALGYEVVSTGGSAKAISDVGVEVTSVDQITSFPEMLDGRVKTLHPAVHGGILARRDLETHVDAVKKHDIGYIDVVAVNRVTFEYGLLRLAINVTDDDEPARHVFDSPVSHLNLRFSVAICRNC